MAEAHERQHDEIESLRSIYADIFTDATPTSKVWSRRASPHFQIALLSHENPARPVVSLVLDIAFTPTYPLLLPVVRVVRPRNLLKARLAQIEARIDAILREYLGEEICFTVIMDVKEMLDEFQQTTEQVLSLEEERAKRIAREREVLEKQEQELLRKEQRARIKQSLEANEQILEMNGDYAEDSRGSELDRAAATPPASAARTAGLMPPPSSSQAFAFDNPLAGEIPHSNIRYQFQAVQGFIRYEGRDLLLGVSKQYIVKPYLPPAEQARLDERNLTVLYLLTEVALEDKHWLTIAGKSEIRTLELQLESVLVLNSPAILKLVGFQIDQDHRNLNAWTVRILTDFEANQQSVMDILLAAGSVNWALARSWMIQALPALEYLHNFGLAHGLICPQSMILCDLRLGIDSNDLRVIKLCHPTYASTLLRICHFSSKSPASSFVNEFIPKNWAEPDPTASMARSDIWQLGVLFMRIMLDASLLEFPTPEAFLNDFDARSYSGIEEYAERIYDLLRKMIQLKASKRSTLLELNALKFFRSGFDGEGDMGIDRCKGTAALVSELNKRDPLGSSRYQKATLDAARRNSNTTASRRHSNQTSHFTSSSVFNKVSENYLLSHGDLSSAAESRYAREFEEVGKLGKGGFGEVVKARNRMEGTFYAIKKIKHRQNKLENLLNEVFSLARLNHQYIVRYYGCWVEEVPSLASRTESAIASDDDDETCSDSSASDLDDFEGPLNVQSSSFIMSHDSSYQVDYFTNSVASLDYDDDFDDRIVFAHSHDDDNTSDSEHDTQLDVSDSSSEYSSMRSKDTVSRSEFSHTKSQAKSILYIQMEFCENNTLLDLIERGLPANPSEYWRLLRQMLEAVSYIHSSGFIHRDLKPTNIFIDKSNNVKVGDFGLAKNSQFSSAILQNNQVFAENQDLSTVVGTFFYTAKEVATGKYDEKVDMYSLGIIFFEMCYQLGTGMERAMILNNMRLEEVKFPSDFSEKKKSTEKQLIRKLLNHDPFKRPGASELLQSGLLPVEHQDVVIREALKSLADPASPWQQQVRETLFNQPYLLARDIMFDRVSKNSHGGVMEPRTGDYLVFNQTLAEVMRIFRNHGALQEFSGSFLLPKSLMQNKEHVFELLDRSGSVLTLNYDLVLPLARFLSREDTRVKKSFTHEFVYRPTLRGTSKPDKYSAVAFDVFSHSPGSLVSDSAECLKAADEILNSLPCFKMKNVQSHIIINHLNILNSVIDFAFGASHLLSQNRRYELMGVLSQLGVERGAEEIKTYLRNDFKLQHTVVKDLIDVFNFTVEPEKAKHKLRKMMVDSPLLLKVEKALNDLTEILSFARKLGVSSSIFFCPLSNYNAKYYDGAFMFQVIYRIEKNRKYSRIATGGRYDSLIANLSNEGLTSPKTPHAVGFQLAMTLLFLIMKNSRWRSTLTSGTSKTTSKWKPVRCDVLVVCMQDSIIKDGGYELLGDIWAHDISCDWYIASSHEDMMNKAETDGSNWIIHLKQTISHGRKSKKGQYKPVRVKNVQMNKDTDLDYDEVLSFLASELLERDTDITNSVQQNSGASGPENSKDAIQESHRIGEPIFSVDIDQRVVIIPNLAKGKKSNKRDKWEMENDSKLASANMLKELGRAPILTVDLSDAILDMILSTSLLIQQEEWLKRAFAINKQLPRSFGVNIYESLKKEAEKGTRWVVLHAPKSDKTTIVDLQK